MKFLAFFNLFGVIALAALCAVQWQVNSEVNLKAVSLDKTCQEQAQKIAEQDRTIKGNMSDLDDFRRRLELSDKSLRETETKVATLTSDLERTTAERDAVAAARDQLLVQQRKIKAVLDEWIAADKQSQDSLQKANDEIRKLASDRNDAVAKFNDLAGKYNGLVEDFNAMQAKLAGKG